MKILFRILALAVPCLFCVSEAQGQNFRLSVACDDEPLIYSHIFINGEYCCYSDTTGVAYIPLSKLSPGDTISASYVGMEPGMVVYDAKLASEGRCQIGLKPDLTLGEITVYSSDNSMALFKKYVSFRNFPIYDRTYQAHVDHYSNPGMDKPREYRGDISIVFHRYYDPKESSWFYFYKFYDSVPACDTINQRQVALRLMASLSAVPRISSNRFVPRYLGEEEGQHVFALTMKPGYGWQYLLRVDKASKKISEMEISYPLDNYVIKMNIVFSDGYIKEAMYTAIWPQGKVIRIAFSNVSFDVNSWKNNYKNFKNHPKTWTWYRTYKVKDNDL